MKPVSPSNSFGTRLKTRRLALGLSQTQLAEAQGLDTSPNMISLYERDQVSPSLNVVSALAKALDTTVGYLAGESKSANIHELNTPNSDIQSMPDGKQSDIDYPSVGQRIKEMRNLKRFTMTDLANATGLTQPQLSHYENNDNLPNAKALISLGKALDISIHYLLTGEYFKTDHCTDPYYLISNQDVRLIDSLLRELKKGALSANQQ
jgi:transcriptional regulator with XRE-family HTH domain